MVQVGPTVEEYFAIHFSGNESRMIAARALEPKSNCGTISRQAVDIHGSSDSTLYCTTHKLRLSYCDCAVFLIPNRRCIDPTESVTISFASPRRLSMNVPRANLQGNERQSAEVLSGRSMGSDMVVSKGYRSRRRGNF